jgi:hypothetical protein
MPKGQFDRSNIEMYVLADQKRAFAKKMLKKGLSIIEIRDQQLANPAWKGKATSNDDIAAIAKELKISTKELHARGQKYHYAKKSRSSNKSAPKAEKRIEVASNGAATFKQSDLKPQTTVRMPNVGRTLNTVRDMLLPQGLLFTWNITTLEA